MGALKRKASFSWICGSRNEQPGSKAQLLFELVLEASCHVHRSSVKADSNKSLFTSSTVKPKFLTYSDLFLNVCSIRIKKKKIVQAYKNCAWLSNARKDAFLRFVPQSF